MAALVCVTRTPNVDIPLTHTCPDKQARARKVQDNVKCSNRLFGDPAPLERKTCYCLEAQGRSAAAAGLGLLRLSGEDEEGGEIVRGVGSEVDDEVIGVDEVDVSSRRQGESVDGRNGRVEPGCEAGLSPMDGRPQGRVGEEEGLVSHDKRGAMENARLRALAETGGKAGGLIVLCTVMWDATALLGAYTCAVTCACMPRVIVSCAHM